MRYPLPYAFARTHQLLLEDDDGQLTLCLHADCSPSALSEVLRKYPTSQLQTLAAHVLIQRISAAYAQGESSAAAVVNEVESDADLSRMMQDLPALFALMAAVMPLAPPPITATEYSGIRPFPDIRLSWYRPSRPRPPR